MLCTRSAFILHCLEEGLIFSMLVWFWSKHEDRQQNTRGSTRSWGNIDAMFFAGLFPRLCASMFCRLLLRRRAGRSLQSFKVWARYTEQGSFGLLNGWRNRFLWYAAIRSFSKVYGQAWCVTKSLPLVYDEMSFSDLTVVHTCSRGWVHSDGFTADNKLDSIIASSLQAWEVSLIQELDCFMPEWFCSTFHAMPWMPPNIFACWAWKFLVC